MGAILNKVFVVDCEATCWETKEEQGSRPNEIIEIGICELDVKTGIISNCSSYVVKPRFTTVSPFCTQLTGWTQEDVNGGADIGDTLNAISKDYGITNEHIWFSYGEYDRIKLGSDGKASVGGLYGITRWHNPFAQARYNNVKTLFALQLRLGKEVGMDKAINMIGETLEGRHHNGADDAWNIAKIVRKVLS
jgi:inhibitor of KinA sporulation pathway (predicted exonuclease)